MDRSWTLHCNGLGRLESITNAWTYLLKLTVLPSEFGTACSCRFRRTYATATVATTFEWEVNLHYNVVLQCIISFVDNTTVNLSHLFGVLDRRFFPGLVEVHLQLIGLLFKEAALVGIGIRRRPAAVATSAALFGIGSCDIDRKTIT